MKKKVKLQGFIGEYENFISDIECDKAIEFFEQQQKFKNTFTRKDSEASDNLFKKDSQFFADQTNLDIWVSTLKPLVFNFDVALKNYEEQTSIKQAYSIKDFKYTSFKIQKTLPGEGYHVWHVEHGPGEMKNRALAWLVYLNDVAEGGETEFLNQSIRIKPKKNKIVIWPAGFPYVHRGNPPLGECKYILTSWMLV